MSFCFRNMAASHAPSTSSDLSMKMFPSLAGRLSMIAACHFHSNQVETGFRGIVTG